MADEASAAAAVQEAGNGEAKVSKNALKKQVMPLALGPTATLPFSFPHFFSTRSVRKCNDSWCIHIQTKMVFTFTVI